MPKAIKTPVIVSEPNITSKPSAAITAPLIAPCCAAEVLVVLDADQRGGQRPEGVRDRGPLRDGGHRHPDRDRRADGRAKHQPDHDPGEIDDLAVQQRADHGHQHADGGQLHAAAGLVGRGQPAQAEDEQHRRGQVASFDEQAREGRARRRWIATAARSGITVSAPGA